MLTASVLNQDQQVEKQFQTLFLLFYRLVINTVVVLFCGLVLDTVVMVFCKPVPHSMVVVVYRPVITTVFAESF